MLSIRTALYLAALVALVALPGCGRSPLAIDGDNGGCGAGISRCGGQCSDTRWDPSNCGGCFIQCGPGTFCDYGRCVATSGPGGGTGGGGTGGSGGTGGGGSGGTGGGGTGGGGGGTGGGGGGTGGGCDYPKQICGATCVDTSSDAANCGSCGWGCPTGQRCSMSTCVQGCAAPLVACNGTCVATDSDAANCGSCGHACAATQACNGGTCATPCPAGSAFCHGSCVVLDGNAAHCGGCDIACRGGESCQAGLCRGSASIWPTLGGDVHHTGHNPTETGTPPLSLAWSISLGTGALWPAVSDGSVLYVSGRDSFNNQAGARLSAIAPTDGQTLWQYNFGNVFSIGQPTVRDGHVYIAQSNNGGSTYMYSLVAANGTLLWSQPFSSQWEHYWAPLVIGGRIYADGGAYGGLCAFDQASGAQLFFAYEEQWDEWSPLYFDNHVFTFTDGQIRRIDPVSGAVDLATTVMWDWNGYTMNTSPVSDGKLMYIISPPNLIAFHPTLGRPAWTANAAYASQPAVADGVVYSISGGQLRANDAATGALSWSFAGDSALDHPPVVAAGYVYVASEANVYAVDVAAHTQAWTNTPGGWLSVAGGQLVVASDNGVLTAWSLTR